MIQMKKIVQHSQYLPWLYFKTELYIEKPYAL